MLSAVTDAMSIGLVSVTDIAVWYVPKPSSAFSPPSRSAFALALSLQPGGIVTLPVVWLIRRLFGNGMMLRAGSNSTIGAAFVSSGSVWISGQPLVRAMRAQASHLFIAQVS